MVYINDQYRFIFIENPKSGSTAIIIALNTILNNIISREFNVNDAHKTSEQVRSEIGLERWNSYFKFTTFRDPLERFCSSMNFIYHKKIIDKGKFDVVFDCTGGRLKHDVIKNIDNEFDKIGIIAGTGRDKAIKTQFNLKKKESSR